MSQHEKDEVDRPRVKASLHSTPGSHFEPSRASPGVLVTVLMPCLNEARTLAACIQQAHAGCLEALSARKLSHSAIASGPESASQQSGSDGTTSEAAPEFTYEILIADNGSSDGSPEIAAANGARVVHVEQKGYGAALQGGIAAARGKYIVMGDSDCSYDFGEVPRLLDKLEEGYDLVNGNRFGGGIMPGAMPWHQQYIGNPVLSSIGRLLYLTPCRDWHCGLRALDRKKMLQVNLCTPGMEFASEMLVRGIQNRLRTAEVSVVLRPDCRARPPLLRSARDGLRHLSLMFSSLTSWRLK
jgi:glycosyltransferase involved in cell wall biosynthesis